LASLPLALEAAEQANQNTLQPSLFGEIDQPIATLKLVDTAQWNDVTRLQEEKLAVGFYLSGHLFDAYRVHISPFLKTQLKYIKPKKETQWLAGIVHTLRVRNGERGRMGFVELDDGQARVDVAIFNQLFDQHRAKIKEDNLLIIEAKISDHTYSGGLRIVAEKVYELAEARDHFARGVTIQIADESVSAQLLSLLQTLPRGACPVKIHYQTSQAQCLLQLAPHWAITLQDESIALLKQQFGPQAICIEY
jgi:DNA polymerase-3 subunit alpha